ncbi:MAG: CpXC domain-containing protein [Anaerolineae bacterium]
MSTPTYQAVPVTCPNCQHRFVSPVLTVVDAGRDPEAKALFLSGQVNVAVCPQCGYAGMLNAPLVYHDPEKELLFTYVPPELNLPEPEREEIIGDLTSRLMSSLPPEQRKGYLLRPRSFLSLDGMLKAVLEEEGITPEMMEAQRHKVELLEQLLNTSSEEERQATVSEAGEQIDYEFFEILTLQIQMAQSQEQDQVAQDLLALRQQLLEWTTEGQDIAAREEAIRELGSELTREELVDKLASAAMAGKEAKVETMVAVARPLIDYPFYQELAGRIEAAQQAGKADEVTVLKKLRETVLDLTAQLDAEMQEAAQEAAELLESILESEDLEQAIRANLADIDDLFLTVLASNLEAAERQGRSEDAEQLRRVGDTLMKLVRESQPPVIQFINELLEADYPDGTRKLLDQRRDQLDERLLELMAVVAEDLARGGRETTAERLRQIRQQATAMLALA